MGTPLNDQFQADIQEAYRGLNLADGKGIWDTMRVEAERKAAEEPILGRMELGEDDYEVGHYWEEGKTQVDLIVENPGDRESRVLELKWINKLKMRFFRIYNFHNKIGYAS